MLILFRIIEAKLRNLLGLNIYPIRLVIAVTFLCNARCKICNIWKLYLDNPEKIREELSFEELRSIFDEVGGNLLWVEITGGEPFLKAKLLSSLIVHLLNETKVQVVSVTTNGLLQDEIVHVVEDILNNSRKDKTVAIFVSIDGLPRLHDSQRGVKGAYLKAMRTYVKLKKLQDHYRNLEVGIAYTISGMSAGNLSDFIVYMHEKLGIPFEEISIAVEHSTEFYNRERKINQYDLKVRENLERDVKFYVNYIDKKARKSSLGIQSIMKLKLLFQKFYTGNIIRFLRESNRQVIPCSAGVYAAYMDPYGNLYPCTQWMIKLGNIRTNNFLKLWCGYKAQKVRALIKHGLCPNCWTPCEAKPSWLLSFKSLIKSMVKLL